MLKLTVSFSRKVGEPNYGSRGASVSVELELESRLARNPKALRRCCRRLFFEARKLVDEELRRSALPATSTAASTPSAENHRLPASARNGRGNGRHSTGGNGQPNGRSRPATRAQLRAIRLLAARVRLDPLEWIRKKLGRQSLEQLTMAEASRLIDRLQSHFAHAQQTRAG